MLHHQRSLGGVLKRYPEYNDNRSEENNSDKKRSDQTKVL